jgi:hypothetical protein
MLLGPAPEGIGPLNFVHHRIIGGVTGFLTGGPAGAVGGFAGGGRPAQTPYTPHVVPSMGFQPPSGQPPCIPPFRRDPLTGSCKIFAGTQSGPDPAPGVGVMVAPQGQGLGLMHHPHAPEVVDVRTRRCGKGHVLSWQGMCVSKKEIRNKDRMWPAPRRPLGTPGDLNAVSKAASFGRRLNSNKKRLKRLEKDLAKATGGR